MHCVALCSIVLHLDYTHEKRPIIRCPVVKYVTECVCVYVCMCVCVCHDLCVVCVCVS